MSQETILVIGAGGKTGARVNNRLKARNIATRAVSRSTEVPFDWERAETWAPAFAGISRAYVTFQPDIAVEGAADAIAGIAGIARGAGLKQVVLLSGRGEPGAERAEAALQASGVPWTIVRSSFFCQNFSEGFLVDSILAGEVALPAGPVPDPFIDVEDLADVVVATLTDERHIGKIYEATGPRALTFADAIAEISQATGRPVHYRQVTPDAFADMMAPYVPSEIVELLLELFTVALDGRNVAVMNGVETVLGRAPRDFSDYVRDTAATGVWESGR